MALDCPMHGPDRTPSFRIGPGPAGLYWHCFACGWGGSGPRFVEPTDEERTAFMQGTP